MSLIDPLPVSIIRERNWVTVGSVSKPKPVGPAIQDESSKPGSCQSVPSDGSTGMNARPGDPEVSTVVGVIRPGPMP